MPLLCLVDVPLPRVVSARSLDEFWGLRWSLLGVYEGAETVAEALVVGGQEWDRLRHVGVVGCLRPAWVDKVVGRGEKFEVANQRVRRYLGASAVGGSETPPDLVAVVCLV